MGGNKKVELGGGWVVKSGINWILASGIKNSISNILNLKYLQDRQLDMSMNFRKKTWWTKDINLELLVYEQYPKDRPKAHLGRI